MSQSQKLINLETVAKVAHVCGGTVSSENLRECLALQLEGGLTLNERLRLDVLIETWREALKRHNAQPVKFNEYDIETGEPKD